MGTLTNLNDVKRALAVASNVNGTLSFDKNLDDTLIAAYIEQASGMIERATRRNFSAAVGTLTLDVTRRYVHGRRLFFHDDVVSITRIENDGGGTLLPANWVTVPRDSGPHTGVILKSNKIWQFANEPEGAIRVIGKIGYSDSTTPPALITLATTKLASWLYTTRDNRGTVRYANRSVEIPAEAPNIVQDIVDQFQRDTVWS